MTPFSCWQLLDKNCVEIFSSLFKKDNASLRARSPCVLGFSLTLQHLNLFLLIHYHLNLDLEIQQKSIAYWGA